MDDWGYMSQLSRGVPEKLWRIAARHPFWLLNKACQAIPSPPLSVDAPTSRALRSRSRASARACNRRTQETLTRGVAAAWREPLRLS